MALSPPTDPYSPPRAEAPPSSGIALTDGEIESFAGYSGWFKRQVHIAGGGNYQTLINEALRGFIADRNKSIESLVRRVVREERQRARGPRRSKSAA